MKKGQVFIGMVERVDFPNLGVVRPLAMFDEIEEIEKELNEADVDARVKIKNVLPGQKLKLRVTKNRKGKAEGRVLELLEKGEYETQKPCIHANSCGGCLYQGVTYENQLQIKEEQIKRLFTPVLGDEKFDAIFEGVHGSPKCVAYRNKMEFSFGDAFKDGPLTLGMHKRGSFYDIETTDHCQIVDDDFNKVLSLTLDYFTSQGATYYKKMSHTGYLRHLLVRRAEKTGEILVDLVTSSQKDFALDYMEQQMLMEWKDLLLEQEYNGNIAGILHTLNDREADVVEDQGTEVLFGQSYFTEKLYDLNFKITPFSFFQTNSLGAEVLYGVARDYIKEYKKDAITGKVVYDLYSGTGTIAQILAPVASKVIGVEIVEEAVEAAKENAKINGLDNCDFLAGDVLKVIDDIETKPDFIVLDPPRDGIHPKAITKIIDYGVDALVYISCKPTSLARDLEIFMASGYEPVRMSCVDMFPFTGNMETVCLLSKR